MSVADRICLEIEDRRIDVQVRRRGRVPSLHSDRDLLEIHGVVTTEDDQLHSWLSGMLTRFDQQSYSACDAEGERLGRWLVSWNSYSVSSGVHTYTVILSEAEELSLEVLLLDEFELYPYEYRERIIGGSGLALEAKVAGTRDDLHRLGEELRAHDVFSVVRRGINPQPRRMRVGLSQWSPFEDSVKYRIVLVDEQLDAAFSAEVAVIEEENTHAALSFYANLIDRLTATLEQKGVITGEELATLRGSAAAEPGVRRRGLWRVADIDAG